jgi:hypothetical protein
VTGVVWAADQPARAAWIADRLQPFDSAKVGSVVPQGFESYVKVLHPAFRHRPIGPQSWEVVEEPVRWAMVSDWSGLPLRPEGDFHSVALARVSPAGDPPFDQGPSRGSLPSGSFHALVRVLAGVTPAAQPIWFCVWAGYGWSHGDDSPVPKEVRRRPAVSLPNREYYLFGGELSDGAVFLDDFMWEQSPNLFWPEDRSWCVGTEVDLACTYIGGDADLCARLRDEAQLETLPATTDDALSLDDLDDLVEPAVSSLLAEDSTVISTPMGNLSAQVERSPINGAITALRIHRVTRSGNSGESWTPTNSGRLVDNARDGLAQALIDLVR